MMISPHFIMFKAVQLKISSSIFKQCLYVEYGECFYRDRVIIFFGFGK